MKHARIFLASVLAACGRNVEFDNAEDADETAVVSSLESALVTELSDEVMQPMTVDPAGLAMAAAARVPARFLPAGCLTATVSGSTVTWVATSCSGPYGLVQVTGTITATYLRTSSGALRVDVTAASLSANGATVDLSFTVKPTQMGGMRTAEVVGDTNGTGPRGNRLERSAQYISTWDPVAECLSLSGSWISKSVVTSSTEVTALRRCKGGCPETGGTVRHTVGAVTVTVSYDGSSKATWSSSTGRQGTVTLKCN